MGLIVTGLRTTIVQELKRRRPEENIIRFNDNILYPDDFRVGRYLFAAGIIRSRRIHEQTEEEYQEGIYVNLMRPMRVCDAILSVNHSARICIIGSASGDNGCTDMAYAACKAAIHQYVQNRHLGENQLLSCVIPPTISDAGMTTRRPDYPELLNNKRTVTTSRVVDVVENYLYGNKTGNYLHRL